jgi:hypothetical protein
MEFKKNLTVQKLTRIPTVPVPVGIRTQVTNKNRVSYRGKNNSKIIPVLRLITCTPRTRAGTHFPHLLAKMFCSNSIALSIILTSNYPVPY